MAAIQSKKDKELIRKEVIVRLKRSVHYLHWASMLIRKMDNDKEKIKDDTDFLGYTGADIESLIEEYES